MFNFCKTSNKFYKSKKENKYERKKYNIAFGADQIFLAKVSGPRLLKEKETTCSKRLYYKLFVVFISNNALSSIVHNQRCLIIC